jgi:predicted Rossmann-fold nucleotide-binding protein
MRIDLESLDAVDERFAAGQDLAGCFVQSVDLSRRSEVLRASDVRGAVFLGCTLQPGDASHLIRSGALVFPRLPDLPFDPYRPALYTPDELYSGLSHGYPTTPDAAIFAWAQAHLRPGAVGAELSATLHDHAVTEALEQAVEALEGPAVVGIMGGHAARRGSSNYRSCARLAHALSDAGHPVISGGGPGAMEAANLGASLVGPTSELDRAIEELAGAATWSADITAWARAAFDVRQRFDLSRMSFGVPTWHYGHEPPNAFAGAIAKYFTNALREDVLLRLCRGGLVYLPGAAGTVQEIFQATTPRYYAAEQDSIAPLLLLGVEFWTETVPAWPLLHGLAGGRRLAGAIHLVDTAEEALGVLRH